MAEIETSKENIPMADHLISHIFENMPRTLFQQVHEDPTPATLGIYFPKNYTAEKVFPLILWMNGGDGGPGNNLGQIRKVIGDLDFICVNMPLFMRQVAKAQKGDKNYWSRMFLTHEETDINWTNDLVMIQKLFEMIPNIDKSHTFMGGFSNGAHNTANLLSFHGSELQKYFKYFVFVEGGILMDRSAILKDHHILLMAGEKSLAPPMEQMHQFLQGVGARSEYFCMPEIGHAFPQQYHHVLLEWMKKRLEE